ncbi:MAG: MarR family transcriptional regulator, partial [Casimicrobiaceae bacterium]
GYRQDRRAMNLGNFTGIPGIPNQDIVMWETMGPIADRSNDRLGASDLAIVEFRKVMVDAVTRFRDGAAPLGASVPRSHLQSFEGVVPKGTDWRTLGETAPTSREMEQDHA